MKFTSKEDAIIFADKQGKSRMFLQDKETSLFTSNCQKLNANALMGQF